MVGVAVKTFRDDDLTSTQNPMVKHLLKVREEHARAQKYDYSHLFRKKTTFELFRLSTLAMSIELAYAAETSFVSPILLQIGIDHKHMTMAWGVSPLIGFFLSPFLGSLSDRCHLNWGRRRPILTLLSVGLLAGLLLVPYGTNLGVLLGDVGYNSTDILPDLANASDSAIPSAKEGTVAALQTAAEAGLDPGPNVANFKYAAIFTILGMVLLDFDADTSQTPLRTYLLDMCTSEDQSRALTTLTIFAGLGGTVGYAIGGIDWETTQIGTLLGGNIPTVFSLVTIVFIVCYFITITTFREVPLKLMEQDEMLRPLSAAAIKKELNRNNNAVYSIKETSKTTSSEPQSAGANNKLQELPMPSYQNGYSPALNQENGVRSSSIAIDDDDSDKPVSLGQYLKSIFVMPCSMRILTLTNLLCWMSHIAYCLYFTDFVGEAVFHGDPAAPPNSEAANLYEDGVRFGCWGMSIYAFSCSMYSMAVTRLLKYFGGRTVYISSILYYAVGMLILGLWPTKWGVLVFSTSAGILYGTVFTVPFILVAKYHSKNCFHIRDGENVPLKQKRGLGTDVAIINSMIFVAQFVVAFLIGPLVAWMQTTSAILYASSALACLAAISAIFVLYV